MDNKLKSGIAVGIIVVLVVIGLAIYFYQTKSNNQTPSPKTPSPVTPSPVTPSPKTPSPVTPSPVTPSPVTPSPVTPSPVTPPPKVLSQCELCMENCNKITDRNQKLLCQLTKCGSLCT